MLLYEYRIRDEFESVKNYAENLRAKFNQGVPSEELLKDRDNLDCLCKKLNELLPEEIRGTSNLDRHLWWMQEWLRKAKPDMCRGDIEVICSHDIPTLEKHFREWCSASLHYDEDLIQKISNLLIRQEYDSAIRKAFVILKSRLVAKFGVDHDLDGADLVNRIFGASGLLSSRLESEERQAMRDLLAGLYGVFRNKYGHQDVEAPWHEADAILSMINFVLKRIEEY